MKQNMQNQAISELYTDDKRSKYSSNPNDILKSAKNLYELLYTEEKISKTPTLELFTKTSKLASIFLEKVKKSTSSQKNNKPPGKDGPTAEFYKHFSNELFPILLNVYDSWEKLCNIAVSSGTGFISIKYKKMIKKILQTIDPSHF